MPETTPLTPLTPLTPEPLPDRLARLESLLATPTDKPTLVYFDLIGIAWPIRALLHAAEVDYELLQFTIPEWITPNADGTFPIRDRMRNSHVPLYVEGDLRLGQSNVILTHLATQHGFMGDTPREALAISEVMAHAYDALFHWSGLFPVNARMNIPDDVVQKRIDSFYGEGAYGVSDNGYERNLTSFENYLAANPTNSGFMVGSRLSAADLHAFNVLCNWYKAFDRERFVRLHPILEDYIERIATIPAVTDYILKHQEPTVWIPIPGTGVKLNSPEESRGLTSVDR